MTENIIEKYFALLSDSTNPAKVLSSAYAELFDVQPTVTIIKNFNQLIKIFGRFNVFFSLIDLASRDLPENFYPYLYTICRKRFERQSGTALVQGESLEKYVAKMEKEISKVSSKPINPEPLDEE